MAATDQSQSTVPSRRAVLAGALAGLGAWAAGVIGRPGEARAADGGNFILGQQNYATVSTRLTNNTNDHVVLAGASVNAGDGVWGSSGSGNGVFASSESGDGLSAYANSGRGVYANSNTGIAVYADADANIGVFGFTAAAAQAGVLGKGGGNGTGVLGFSGPGTEPTALPKTGVFGYANQDASAVGVVGGSAAGVGVRGISTNSDGIQGGTTHPDASGVWGDNSGGGYGVAGSSNGGAAAGVWGSNSGAGTGVRGTAVTGRGVHGVSVSGHAGYFEGKVYTSKFHEMPEISTPSAPGADKARIFVRDNGSGKTQLCVRFNTGAVKVLATQP